MTKQEFVKEKEQIRKDIVGLLEKTKSDFDLEDVQDLIYNEEDQGDFQKLIAMFDDGGDITELNNTLEIVSDAWNYFPHKALGGLSP